MSHDPYPRYIRDTEGKLMKMGSDEDGNMVLEPLSEEEEAIFRRGDFGQAPQLASIIAQEIAGDIDQQIVHSLTAPPQYYGTHVHRTAELSYKGPIAKCPVCEARKLAGVRQLLENVPSDVLIRLGQKITDELAHRANCLRELDLREPKDEFEISWRERNVAE